LKSSWKVCHFCKHRI